MNETMIFEEFQKKFRVDELTVFKNDSWTWSVRPGQPTLGSGIISLNRYALRFSDVTSSEMADLADLISQLEKSVKSVFDHNIMNYLMLMMVDHHVHYHVVPRYDGSRQFAGLEWVDNGWPALPVLPDNQHSDQPNILSSIKEALFESL